MKISAWFLHPVSEAQIARWRRLWLWAAAVLVMFFLAAPALIVIPMSFSESQYLEFPPKEWSLASYRAYFESREWMAATRTSLLAALGTMLLATPLGMAAAYGLLAAETKWTGRLFTLLVAPMMVPVVLVAVAVFYVFVQVKLVNTLAGLILAHSLLALPLALIIFAAGLRSFDMNQERVARSLGASRARAFWTVTLPQLRFSAVSAALLSFLTSFDEVIVALFIAGSDNSTITRAMFLALRDKIDPTIASVSTLMIVVTTVLLLLAQKYGRKTE